MQGAGRAGGDEGTEDGQFVVAQFIPPEFPKAIRVGPAGFVHRGDFWMRGSDVSG
jgi:hypothetical protein